MHLLIVKTSSLGDVIHALPLVSDLARMRPQARIDWAVEEAFAAIPRLHPAVAQVIPVALRRWRRSLWRPATWGEVAQARARLREADYDLVLDCQGLVKSALVARWAQAPVAGPDRRSAREPLAARAYSRPVGLDRSLHAVARNRALGAAALGYSIDGEPPRFGLAAGSVPAALAAQVAAPYAVLLTNASRSSKLWPDERWTAVAAALAGRGWASLLFWGSDEEGERTRARAAGMQRATVMPRCSLPDIAAVLARAQVVVGLDTGLTHLAAALDVPTIGLFCDYDPRLVGLTGARCTSLGGVAAQPAVAQVLAAVEQVLAS